MLIWQHLPLVLFADVVLCLSVLPALAVWLLGLTVPAIWVAALTLGPVWMGINACANRLLCGEDISWRELLKEVGHQWRTGVAISMVPAFVATLALGTWSILAAHPQLSWLYVPLFIDGCVATFVVLACLTVFALATSCSLRGWQLWKVALAVTTLRPGTLLGTLAIFVGLGLLLVLVNVGLLPLLCAPCAICLAARTRQIRMDIQTNEG